MVDKNFKYIVRIFNTDINGKLKLIHGLTKIKGISNMFSNAIVNILTLDKNQQVGLMQDEDIEKINSVLKTPAKFGIPIWMLNRRRDYETGEDIHILTTDLQFIKDNDLKRLKKIKCYRGVRHMFRLPVRGQRTKSNFRKNKGKVTGVKRKK